MGNFEKQYKIMIVDDHPATRKLMQDILQEYTVLSAANGRDALALLAENPDTALVLLDIIMPQMNGYEVCRKIKNNPATSDIPVIFLTIMAEEQDESLGFMAGVNDYITKPICRLRLLARVKNQLQIRRQRELLNHKNAELQKALDEIKVLNGILPICSFCKRICSDNGEWQKIESYICQHSEANFSHGVCPDCLEKHYPEGKD
ncbi:MAG: response regulator [Deltaproteobacteria bacterium]|nr:response regulator [Deltaproteobacteria bacterium]